MDMMSVDQIRVIKMMLENVNHPDPVMFLARGYYLTKLKHEISKDYIGYMKIPLSLYDELFIPPDSDSIEDVTDIAAKVDIMLYSDEGLGTEDVLKWWIDAAGESYNEGKYNRAVNKVMKMLTFSVTNEDIKEAFEEAVNDSSPSSDIAKSMFNNQLAYFRTTLINKLGD